METRKLQEGVFLHIQQTKAFKENRIDLYFTKPLDKSSRPKCLLLSQMIPEAGKNMHEKRKLIAELDALYGADLSISTFPIGDDNCLVISLSAIQETYVQEKILLPQWRLLGRLLHPSFSRRQLHEARQQALFNVAAEREDPAANSQQEALRLCTDNMRLTANPTEDMYKAVTLSEIEMEFADLLEHGRIDICALIGADTDRFLSIMQNTVSFAPRPDVTGIPSALPPMKKRSRQIAREGIQSALTQLYDTGIALCDPQMPALMLADGILGALPVSLLFQEVREKNSLCYEIASDLYLYDGLLQITAQMHPAKQEAVMELIQMQIERIRHGDFSDELLDEVKRIYESNSRSGHDFMAVRSREMFIEALLQMPDLHRQIQNAFSLVRREDIMQAASSWHCRVNFLQTGNGDEHVL